jgi:hypothetical protein
MLLAAWPEFTTPACAAAPKDAIANLPSVSNDTYVESFSSDINHSIESSNETFGTRTEVLWSPQPRIALGHGDVGLRLDYIADVFSQTSFPRSVRGSTDNRRDTWDMQLDLHVDGLQATEHFQRADLISPAEQGRKNIGIFQLAATQFRYQLPFGICAQVSDNTSLNYNSPQGVNGSGGEQHSTTATLDYTPAKVGLSQHLKFETNKSSTDNPPIGAHTDYAYEVLEAYREIPLGSVGSLNWAYQHREDSSGSGNIGAVVAANTISEAQQVGVRGGVKDSPVSYGFDFRQSTQQGPVQPYLEHTTTAMQLRLAPQSSSAHGTSLQLDSMIDTTRVPAQASDFSSLQNTLTWNLRPHPRFDSRLTYSQWRTTDNALHELTRDEDRLDAFAGYNFPGRTGGRLDLHFWQDEQAGNRFPFSEDGVELNNEVILGKAASVTFNYAAHDRADNNGSMTLPNLTDYMSTGVTYEIHPGPNLSLYSRWAQSVQVQHNGDLRVDSGHIDLNLTYNPSWEWQYSLTVNGDSDNTHDLQSGDVYRNTDRINARVSFRF